MSGRGRCRRGWPVSRALNGKALSPRGQGRRVPCNVATLPVARTVGLCACAVHSLSAMRTFGNCIRNFRCRRMRDKICLQHEFDCIPIYKNRFRSTVLPSMSHSPARPDEIACGCQIRLHFFLGFVRLKLRLRKCRRLLSFMRMANIGSADREIDGDRVAEIEDKTFREWFICRKIEMHQHERNRMPSIAVWRAKQIQTLLCAENVLDARTEVSASHATFSSIWLRISAPSATDTKKNIH